MDETEFKFYPDRDSNKVFSIRIPISIAIHKQQGFLGQAPRVKPPPGKSNLISIKIENDQGYTCAEKRMLRDLEISGLPCDHCMKGKLLLKLDVQKYGEILNTTHAVLSDESKRMQICNLQPKRQKQSEDLIITSTKNGSEHSCRWVFRDFKGSIGCCYSKQDYYTQSGGCDPRMQSLGCRKGVESPILVEERDSCTLRIPNPKPADSGNYLSEFHYATPGFKKVIIVEEKESHFPVFEVIIICLFYFIIFGGLLVIVLSLTIKRSIQINPV